MSNLLTALEDHVFVITLNRVEKHNAFDDKLLTSLKWVLKDALQDPHVRAIILQANGQHFSAGADLAWMQKMIGFSEKENLEDALILAEVMELIYHSAKPTIALIQGAAFGGGVGLAAVCDITIAATSAVFCFSEVKLGLIPAVISPYVIKSIGERAAKWLFISAEKFNAQRAQQLGLVQHCVPENELWDFGSNYAKQFKEMAPQALSECKQLVQEISDKAITSDLIQHTASLIARKRISEEGQRGLQAFLNKRSPYWN